MRGIILSSLTSLLLVACGSGEPTSGENEDDVVARVLANSAVVKADRLEFPVGKLPGGLRAKIEAYAASANGPEEQVILWGDRADDAVSSDGTLREDAANPLGYIRRALSVQTEGNMDVVMTEPASIEEAFKELERNGVVEVGRGDDEATLVEQGKFTVPTIPLINLKGLELWRDGDNVVRIKKGLLAIDTQVDMGIAIEAWRLQETHTYIDMKITGELVLEGKAPISMDKEFTLPSLRALKFPLPPVGPIAMTLGINPKVGCRVKGSGAFSVDGGIHAETTIQAGFSYVRGEGITPRGDVDIVPTAIMPKTAVGQVSLRCWVTPEVDLLVYDVAGPKITPELSSTLSLESNPNEVALNLGLDVHLGGALRVYGFTLADLNVKLVESDTEIFREEVADIIDNLTEGSGGADGAGGSAPEGEE